MEGKRTLPTDDDNSVQREAKRVSYDNFRSLSAIVAAQKITEYADMAALKAMTVAESAVNSTSWDSADAFFDAMR